MEKTKTVRLSLFRELTTWLLGGFKHPHENFGLFLLGTKLPFTTPPNLPSFVSNPLPSLLLLL